MNSETTAAAAREPFLELLRELARAYQAFESFDARGLRRHGLTAPQADVIFTLGNTDGMAFCDLGEKTLITKGTLTGIVDRLEARGLVRRVPSVTDRRRVIVRLTAQGDACFEEAFPAHIGYLKTRFGRLTRADRQEAIRSLRKIRALFA